MTSNSAPATGAAALLAGAALAGFDGGAIGFLLPAVRADTGSDPQQATWLVTLYVVGTLVAIPAAGMTVRRFGGPAVFRACAALAAAGALLAMLSPGITLLLAARLVQGMAQGPLLPVAAALIAARWPRERQGLLMGALSLAYGVAFLAGMTVTPLLLAAGWRPVFGLMTVAAVAILVGPGLPAARTASAAPDLPMARLAGTRELAAIAVVALGTGVGQVVVVLFPTLAVARLGVTAAGAGVLMLPLAVAGIATTVGITAILDRSGAKPLLVAGAAATLAGILLAATAPVSRITFLAGAGLLGLGISGLSGGPLRYAAARAVRVADQGLAQAGVALISNVGAAGGGAIIGALSARGADEQAAMESAMIVACAMMALCFAPALFLRRHTRDDD